MIRMYCDRCDSEIYGKAYNIKIEEDHSMDAPYNTLFSSISTANINATMNTPKIYCQDCIDKIKRYIADKPIKSSFTR